jgi:hypothetical protein
MHDGETNAGVARLVRHERFEDFCEHRRWNRRPSVVQARLPSAASRGRRDREITALGGGVYRVGERVGVRLRELLDVDGARRSRVTRSVMNEECPALQLTTMRCQHVRPELVGVMRRELHRRRPSVVQE